MSDPAIRAALEAGTYAMQAATDPYGFVPPNPRDRAAAAVAAFLRALPACDVMMERNSWEGGPHSTHTLAAAVERAAREGSS